MNTTISMTTRTRARPIFMSTICSLILDEDDEPQPGFNDEIVGANVGDSREFVLTFPDDAEEYEDMAGKTVRYYVDVKKIETLTLPELTDDFAARVTKDEEKPLTLLELRIRARENLKNDA